MDQPGFNLISYFVIEDSGEEVLVSPVLDTNPVFNIGSDARSHLHLDAPDVEVSHAVVNRRDGEFFIQPRYKDQKVLVNGKSINGVTRLNDNDIVQIGATRLRFEHEERRSQTKAIKPVLATQAALPAVAPALTPVIFSPASSLAPAGSGTIYRPKAKKESGNNNLVTFIALLAGIGVLLVLGFNLLTNNSVIATVAETLPVDFVYDDGNISVLWFDVSDCEPCDEGRGIVRQMVGEFRGDSYLHSYNLDQPTYFALAQKYELTNLPSVVILDDAGVVFTVFTGTPDEDTLRSAFQGALAQSASN